MTKIFFFITCLIISFCNSSTLTNISCEYSVRRYNSVGELYHCFVNDDPKITGVELTQISSVNGFHEGSKTNDNVLGFKAMGAIIQYFPNGLLTFFKNLKAIWIERCKLQEIHQSDLKPFTNLEYFDLTDNKIEVIEEGLFEFNPNLIFVSLWEMNFIHIDPNVFDNLNHLTSLYLKKVPCILKDIFDSRQDVEEVIKLVKIQCVNSEFLSLHEKIENLKNESKTLNLEALKANLGSFEESFNSSKFSKFRPLSYKFENLKGPKNVNPVSEQPELTSERENTLSVFNSEATSKVNNDQLTDSLRNISFWFEDLKHSQCGMVNDFGEVKASQVGHSATLKEIHSVLTENAPKLDQLQTSHNILTSSIETVVSKANEIISSQNQLKASQSGADNSLIKLKSTVNDLQASNSRLISSQNNTINELKLTQETLKSSQNFVKFSQNTIHSSISDIEATVSDLKKSQNEFKESLIKIKNSQNEAKIALNDISMNKNDNIEDKLATFGEKLMKVDEKLGTFEGKFENLEGHFMDFEFKNAEKFEKIEKEIANSRHKMSINFDEQIKGIEKRLMKKFEEVLEEKLGKIFDDKLGNVLDARSGTN